MEFAFDRNRDKHWILPNHDHESPSEYYRRSDIGSAISPQTLQTNWSDISCLLAATAAASSKLHPPRDEPLDPPAAHQ